MLIIPDAAVPTFRSHQGTMSYSKYFKSGQEILLLNMSEESPRQTETISSYLLRCTEDHIDLTLPYTITDTHDIPFAPGTKFCLLSNALGLGIQLTGHLQEIVGRSVMRIKPHDDMEVFGRRKFLRADMNVGVFCKRGPGTLRTYRAQWNAALKSLAAGTAFPPGFSPARIEVNLSAGGIAMPLSPPAAIAELCLVLLDIYDGGQPIIALCEVMWAEMSESGQQTAGLRFAQVMKADQERINNKVIDELKRQGQDVQWQSYRLELLDKMLF